MTTFHWLTTFALIVVIHGHFRMESDLMYTNEEKQKGEHHSASFYPHPRNRTDLSGKISLSVADTGQIAIEHLPLQLNK